MSKDIKIEKPLLNRAATGVNPPAETRFKPGQSGNPSGRPKGSVSLTSAIVRALNEIDPADKTHKRKRLDTLALAIIQQAMAGNKTAIQEIWTRLDGIVQPADPTNDTGGVNELIVALGICTESVWEDESKEQEEDLSYD